MMREMYGPSNKIWEQKYRFSGREGSGFLPDKTVEDTWARVASVLSNVDGHEHYDAFRSALDDFKFLPAGRIVAGAGTGRDVTMMNCFCQGTIPDSLDGIFSHLKEAALTMQQGGGIGYDFSTLRPKGAHVHGVDSDASGPLSFMDVWDSMCKTLVSAGERRGAMMAVMRCDHPDVFDFIKAKREPGRLTQFNLSVLVTDTFVDAVRQDKDWHLVFPAQGCGYKIYRTVRAHELWDEILRNTYAHAEPGVIFIDRINERNNLLYVETIYTTNPCSEQPLPPYGCCLLGSINLVKFARLPFKRDAYFDIASFGETVSTAVRMMDDVIDVTNYPLEQHHIEEMNKRRLGLGVTGLGDALTMLGMRYGSPEAIRWSNMVAAALENRAYRASIQLAEEKGPFPLFDHERYRPAWLDHGGSLDLLKKFGIRNSHLTSIAPTGTISFMADYVSGGIEPVFAHRVRRKVLEADGSRREEVVESYSLREYRKIFGEDPDLTRPEWATAQDLSVNDHLLTMAKWQEYVDSSISKTVNLPSSCTFDEFKAVYDKAYDLGCKSCATYRPSEVRGSVMEVDEGLEEVMLQLEVHNATTPVLRADPVERAILNSPPGCPDLDQGEPHPDDVAAYERSFEAYEQGFRDAVATELAPRPEVLRGTTYKVRWPINDHTFYITINDRDDGTPHEMFINSQDVQSYPWIVALTRMVTAVFRRGGDVSFVADELKKVFDPSGGVWVEGRYVPSLLASIGGVVERHLDERREASETEWEVGIVTTEVVASDVRTRWHGPSCPKCSHPLHMMEGCMNCDNCGYSKCG